MTELSAQKAPELMEALFSNGFLLKPCFQVV